MRGKRLVIEPGTRFGMVTVTSEVASRGNKMRYFLCQCDCGKLFEARLSQLTQGETKSCGCLRRARFTGALSSHGASRTRLYVSWTAMKQRCFNSRHPNYRLYGGRGITVCAEWTEFEPFRDWALAHGYRDDLTIERVDNDGNYEPGNCAWIPQSQQSSNTRRVIHR